MTRRGPRYPRPRDAVYRGTRSDPHRFGWGYDVPAVIVGIIFWPFVIMHWTGSEVLNSFGQFIIPIMSGVALGWLLSRFVFAFHTWKSGFRVLRR